MLLEEFENCCCVELCFFCHTPGHLVADCESLTARRKQQASVLSWPKDVGLISDCVTGGLA